MLRRNRVIIIIIIITIIITIAIGPMLIKMILTTFNDHINACSNDNNDNEHDNIIITLCVVNNVIINNI